MLHTSVEVLQPVQFLYSHPQSFQLESGETLPFLKLAYQTWGTLNESKSNVVWVCHALTGNHRVQDWWGGLFGAEKCFDPANYFIVSVTVPGSPYGSTNPLTDELPADLQYNQFPFFTTRDYANALDLVRKSLEIDRIRVLIGASLGGQQVLEWALNIGDKVDFLIPIATNLKHSPFGIAFNESQRLAIQADETFYSNKPLGGFNGLVAARAIGMLSYRTYRGYELTQSEIDHSETTNFKASTYQKYQGEKLANRFNAYSYWFLSKAMDSHNVFRNRSEKCLKQLVAKSLVIGIDSDILFPIHEQIAIADQLPNAELLVISSDFGHDGFLVETELLATKITQFLNNN